MSQKRLLLMVGLPGSGKSTYVDRVLVPQGFQVVCQDDIRRAYGHHFHGPLEPFVHTMAWMQARQFMLRGLPVVIDEAVCKAAHLAVWKRRAEEMGYTVSAVCVNTPVDVCKQRRGVDVGFPMGVIDRKKEELSRHWETIQEMFPDLTLIDMKEADTCPACN